MSITDAAFDEAQKQELVNWEKDTSNSTRILYELVEHSELAGPLRNQLDQPAGRALEVGVGCFGLGFLAPHMFSQFEQLDGLDPLPRLEINLPDPELQEYVDAIRSRVNYIQAPGETLPFEDETFDLAACINVVDHAQAPEAILREIHRVLKPNALFAFSVSTLSVLGEWKWSLDRRLRPDNWLYLAHPHTYTWPRADRMLRTLFSQVLWQNRPGGRTHVAGHGRMSYWLLRK
jgi:SAM-dependent methyltransferase